MKRVRSVTQTAALAVLVGLSNPAAAVELIVNGGFEANAPTTFFPNVGFTSVGPYGIWVDQLTWGTVSGNGTNHIIPGAPAAPPSTSGGNWARQWSGVTGNTGTMLMQGFSAAGLAAGTQLSISFEYLTRDALTNAQMFLYGLDAGEVWSQFPPNACTGCDVLANPLLSPSTLAWVPFSTSVTLSRTFTAIAFGVYFATINPTLGPTYFAGIDNVSISSRVPQTVAEPGTLVLLGLGLLGVGLTRRRRA